MSENSSFITFFYDFPESLNKYLSWELFSCLNPSFEIPWIVIRNFIQILSSKNKKIGAIADFSSILKFYLAMSDCNWHDLGFLRHRFTWPDMRMNVDNIQQHLDKDLAIDAWQDSWPHVQVSAFPRYKFDHNPILVSYSSSQQSKRKNKSRPKLY